MNDISEFHPLMQAALRTGSFPGDEEIARAVGETTDSISRRRADLEVNTLNVAGVASTSDSADDDQERFRRRYRELVEDMIAQWHDDNPSAGNSIPDSQRQRIEDYCRTQIQHQWKMHHQRPAEGHDDA